MRTLILPDPRERRDEGHASRQLVVLCDGTNANVTGGREDTHVVLLAELLNAHHDALRVVMYDPGVGNPAALPGAGFWDRLHRRWARVEGLTQGRGVFENIIEGYAFLMRHWEPGDEIFVFGFSRGAFTARSLAGLVNRFGIVRMRAESMLTTLLNVYFSPEDPKKDAAADQIVRLFTPERARKVRIQYVGVWDTVEAVGVPPFQMRIPATKTLEDKRFMHVRQALALDECRRMFKPRVYEQPNGNFPTAFGDAGTVVQRWFSGVHADVGGQVPHGEGTLGSDAFHWIVSEAVTCGLQLSADGERLDSEAKVKAAVQALGARADEAKQPHAAAGWSRGQPMRHDTLHRHALWALTGLAQRDTRLRVAGHEMPVLEHPSVAQQLDVPSVWQQRRRPGRGFVAAAWFLVVALFVVMGQLLAIGAVQADMSQVSKEIGSYLGANASLQSWQLLRAPADVVTGCHGESGLLKTIHAGLGSWFDRWRCDALYNLKAKGRALLVDLAFIGCWAFILARWVSWAFARRAGIRRAGQAPQRWLTRLGMALPLAVLADLSENVLTALVVQMLRSGMDVMPIVLGVAMALASVLKWVGIAGALLLVAAGLAPRRAARAAKAGSGSLPSRGGGHGGTTPPQSALGGHLGLGVALVGDDAADKQPQLHEQVHARSDERPHEQAHAPLHEQRQAHTGMVARVQPLDDNGIERQHWDRKKSDDGDV